ncbi:MAG: [LysW]-aminoadipate kinase [Nanoarchaeota archaeon]|nr:[LysW]-aminoadipate kinase [Nanoarchaeota archaeon]MBU1321262.1 [LysW]-aminoadipate kinase [Nanoarchaeota archaeon]MBU1597333.1 [LysW]-aminoadipate kinase [Nanoarchaeota archaeon]MBU2441456.1 [LysW]-aminoadipate kinase [Nanoarchaeota archaeon]
MIVIKVGGALGINYDLFLQDLAGLVKNKNQEIVLVHGGSGELNEISTKLGKPPKMVTSASGHVSRRTDKETLEIFNMVLCGKMNKMIVEKLQQLGVNAIGLSGIDGRLLVGKRKNIIIVEDGKKKIIRDDYTGKIEEVNVDLIRLLLGNGFMPVITPPGLSYENEAINVDGDRAAAIIASSLKAEALVILSNIPGLLKDVDDESSLIKEINKEEIDDYMQFAKKRMKKKVMGATEALNQGVQKVIFGDARIENPITKALEGQGTVIQ